MFPVAALLAVANIPREIFHGRELRAFLSSSCAIVFLMALVGLGLYPTLLRATPDAARSLTIYNSRVIGEDTGDHAGHRHDWRADRVEAIPR